MIIYIHDAVILTAEDEENADDAVAYFKANAVEHTRNGLHLTVEAQKCCLPEAVGIHLLLSLASVARYELDGNLSGSYGETYFIIRN